MKAPENEQIADETDLEEKCELDTAVDAEVNSETGNVETKSVGDSAASQAHDEPAEPDVLQDNTHDAVEDNLLSVQ